MYEPLTNEMDISKLYPTTISDFEEFIEIAKVENTNFNRVKIELLQLFSMRFVNATDEIGIARWEKMLKLKRRPSDTLETRRMKVLSKINNKLPYTWRSLQQLLNSIFGEGNYQINLDPQEYILELLLPSEQNYYREVSEILEPMIPLNIYMIIAEGILKDVIQMVGGSYSWTLPTKICGRFKTAKTHGALGNEILSVSNDAYGFDMNNRICGRFRAGGVRN
ncbi:MULTISPECIES: YmfQ family protein [Lysinibacillus]|uniref:YmfQ family protein n=1 Tax=Lysinibacillus TaxID=400634 RepID=UPI00214CF0C9|nr:MULTISPECIES: YmfQ family protein [Lysinibacillus]UUV26111.1 YmfQ family protein [Lysinibacillus sp. FN11]UYB48984.1 YmfQ family protein [Lysinibacillus capsici]